MAWIGIIDSKYTNITCLLGAVMVERPAEVEESFSQAAPLVYQFGHISMSNNSTLYNTLVSRMAEVIHQRMEDNPRSNFNLYTKKLKY